MKTRFLAASVLALGLASTAFAQPGPGGDMRGGMGMHGGMGMQGGMGMHEGMGMRGGPMRHLRALGLSETQQDQVFKIHHDQAPVFREQMKKVRAAREELHKLAIADNFDQAAVRRAADAQAKAISDLAVMHVQTMRKVRDVLTPEQRSRLDQMRQRHGGPGPRARG